MMSDQLLEVLGGQDLLVMMCDAKRFSAERDSVKFWVGPYIVELTYSLLSDYGYERYVLGVKHRKTKLTNTVERFHPEDILRKFEELTGYSLSF